MKLRVARFAALALAVSLLATACSSGEETPSGDDARTVPSTTAAPAPSGEAKPSTPESPAPLTCDSLVSEATLAEFEANGFVHDETYEQTLRDDNSIEAKFFDFGGIACMWFLPNSDGWAAFGYSEISDADAAAVQEQLVADGYVRSDEGSDAVYALAPETNTLGHDDTFLFEPGAWFHSVQRAGIDEVRAIIAAR
ncbi:hypothetical protein FB562_1634 [Homoserinimonas aerilata]|uniref:Uncharacterized protein n=1 Tax=Homoserinimonas aerilata TaxID=1162970 RepID=A0A542YKB2_9MICO|nr:hypothetical protein [Homoserinimonas aerilata]TQL48539.1 hypothetical protein FB562_1634 [Homoserinimonas aerilata]